MTEKSIADKGDAIRVLEYWYLTEFLNQESIKSYIEIGRKASKYKSDLMTNSKKKPKKFLVDFVQLEFGDSLQTVKDSLPGQLKDFDTSEYIIFIGLINKATCVQRIAHSIQWIDQNPDAKATNNDQITLGVLKFSKDGRYIPDSLKISPLAWAMMKFSGGIENASKNLSITNYNSDTRTIEMKIANMFNSSGTGNVVLDETDSLQVLNFVSYDLLMRAESMICEGLNINKKDITSYLAVYYKLYEPKTDYENESEDIIRSGFYTNDLAYVINGFRNNRFTKEKEQVLIDYILGINHYNSVSEKTLNRFDIIKPKNNGELYTFMAETLSPGKAPLGKWPSLFMPALMQQIAVNLATNPNRNLPIFSVNGPPGTGKTTLLKEIIVHNVVEKATLLAKYENPDDAFDDFSFSNGYNVGHSYNEYYKKYHRFRDKKINEHSILVTSSNNTAVENITKELPIEENILKNIIPSDEAYGSNKEALTELSRLFTVANSEDELPFIENICEECVNEKGETDRSYKKIIVNQPDIYFSRLATDLLNADVSNDIQEKKQAFGLISASLGKRENIDKVKTKVIKPFLDIIGKNADIELRKPNYLEAQKKFLMQLDLVKKLRDELEQLPARMKTADDAFRLVEEKECQVDIWRKNQPLHEAETDAIEQKLQGKIERLNKEKDSLVAETAIIHSICDDFEKKIKAQQEKIFDSNARIKSLQKSVSIFGRLFKSNRYKEVKESVTQERKIQEQYQQQIVELNKKLDEENQKAKHEKDRINILTTEISEVYKELEKLHVRREMFQSEGQRLEQEVAIAKEKAEEQRNLLDKERLNYQNQDPYDQGFILDRQFIRDILSSEQDVSTKAQLRNPWFSEHYNREREKLFLYALQLTKEFILYSKKCRNNFQHLYCLWSGNYNYNKNEQVRFIGDDLEECTAAAYETLFLLIPVVSSTFASVQTLFKNVKEENFIGTLIVDEAGQASPHMAIGALCRSRKAVIVGDPNQVEPVVTDDQDMLKQIYTDYFYKSYKDKTISVQRFADIMNPYGTYLKNANGIDEWVGCPLLVHRRCISPMYEISNDISYGNIMKQQTAQPDADKQQSFIYEKSQWFNVIGKEEGAKRHFVKEQGDKVIQMLEIAFSKNPHPDIFIITPFTTVVSGIKDYINKYVNNCKETGEPSYLVENEDSMNVLLNKNTGTVHTFQGRESAEVIFLLGCDTTEDAKPAIRWVNNNIVNVAATRAKYRFYVIGDSEAWKKSKCVNRARKILDSYVSGNLEYARKNQKKDGSYTLVITEKPSVAEAYAKALCVWNEPTNNFYEGNGYIISWCLGHLIELASPEQYNAKYKHWDLKDLPIIPDEWKYQIMDSKNSEGKKRILQRFDALKALMNRNDVTDILCATDAGREGELIFRLVYQQAECQKPFKRIWLSSMEPASIRNAFDNPNPSSDYDSLYEAARCRQLADWMVGMNASRFYTCRYKNEIKKIDKKTLSVGRVVSPTLAMVVEREKEIEKFVPETYYTVNLNVGGTMFTSRRFVNEDEANQVVQKCGEVISSGS